MSNDLISRLIFSVLLGAVAVTAGWMSATHITVNAATQEQKKIDWAIQFCGGQDKITTLNRFPDKYTVWCVGGRHADVPEYPKL